VSKTLAQRLLAEAVGCVLLAATVVGSGVMGESLANGNLAVALLANTLATVAILLVIITLFAPVSGAHFNPAVTIVLAWRGAIEWRDASLYVAVQILGCCAGTVLAHLMFALPIVEWSSHARSGPSQWLSEVIATFGLLMVVLGHRRPTNAAWLVAAWIGAAYWFTASTSFANPAITIARSLTNTFAGISPTDVPGFIVGETLGSLLAVAVAAKIFSDASDLVRGRSPEDSGSRSTVKDGSK
jgi:glycerol uptake facilitator-like aquaporin